MPQDKISSRETTDSQFLKSIIELQNGYHQLVDLVSQSQARSQGMEVILALVLSKIMDSEAALPIAIDCASVLEGIRNTGLDPSFSKFPDPSLLEEVIGILTGQTRQTWHPYVIAGGKVDPQSHI